MLKQHIHKKNSSWHIMPSISVWFGLLLFVFFFAVHPAFALNLGHNTLGYAASKAGYYAAGDTTFASIIGLIIEFVLSFVGIVFMALTVYAGFLWMTARGEETQVEKAQKIISSSIIGLVVTVAAYGITYYIVPIILLNLIS